MVLLVQNADKVRIRPEMSFNRHVQLWSNSNYRVDSSISKLPIEIVSLFLNDAKLDAYETAFSVNYSTTKETSLKYSQERPALHKKA